MHEDFESQYLNLTTPLDAALLLRYFYQGNILKARTQIFLWNLLLQTQTGANKLKAGLPDKETILLGHKTGSSFRKKSQKEDQNGLKVAENDIGIIVTPKSEYAIAVFIKNSYEDNKTNTQLIAQISRIVFESLEN